MQVGVVNTFISAHPLLSAYFLTSYTYKRMRLITRVYGILQKLAHTINANVVRDRSYEKFFTQKFII